MSIELVAKQKAELRWSMLDRRDALDKKLRAHWSRTITAKLLAMPEYAKAGTVLAYMSIGSEFDTAEIIRDVLASGKILGLPKVNRAKKILDIYQVKNPLTDLLPGVWGIAEPDDTKCERIEFGEVDFVLVPGLAFDQAGNRIGYGGGYYDKLLANRGRKTCLIAAAYSMQMVPAIPSLQHDLKLDAVITELSI